MVHNTAVQKGGRSAKGRETETERIKERKKAVKTRNAFKAGSFSSCIITLRYITLLYITFCFPKAFPLF
jgi:hypothetical protein